MRKFLTTIIFFFFILSVLFFGINHLHDLFNPEPDHYFRQYNELYEDEVKADAIVIGTSHAAHSIRPSSLDSLGLSFYNYSLNGAGPTFYYKWYTELFSKNHTLPKYCVYSVDWFMFDDTWLKRSFEKDSEYFSLSSFLSLLAKPSKYKSKALIESRFPGYKHRHDLDRLYKLIAKYKMNSVYYFNSRKSKKGFIVEEYDKGFIPYEIAFNPKRFKSKRRPVNSIVNADQKMDLIRLVDDMERDGIKLIFVSAPEYGIEKEAYDNAESLDFIDSLSASRNIPLLNYNSNMRNDAILSDITNFSDWGHMSRKGSKEFSTLLAKDLREYLSQ